MTEYIINPTPITGKQIKMRLHQFYVPHQQISGFFKKRVNVPHNYHYHQERDYYRRFTVDTRPL